ncbi:MAG: amidase [Neisseriaceae bacterium]
MRIDEYCNQDGIGLSEVIRRREVSAHEVLDVAVEAIGLVNPKLNFLAQDMRTEAYAQLENLDINASPLAGVPILLKDLLLENKGWPTQSGLAILSEATAQEDSALAAAYRSAGLLFVGKSTTPQLGLFPFTESEWYGITRNPWDQERTPGGSSGGAGAAVAARAVAIAHGGDGGGSIRIPASHCGLFGLKPSRGRITTAPLLDSWMGCVVQHALTRSVRDSAAMLDIAVKAQGRLSELYRCPPVAGSYLNSLEFPLPRLKIAFTDEPFLGGKVIPEVKAAMDHTIHLLNHAGHHIEEARPHMLPPEQLNPAVLSMLSGLVAAIKRELERELNRPLRARDFEASVWAMVCVGEHSSAGKALAARELLMKQAEVMAKFHEQYDLLLTPTMPVLPPKIASLGPNPKEITALRWLERLGLSWTLPHNPILRANSFKLQQHVGFLLPFNCTGQPAISLPLYWHEGRLPVGVQLVAPFGREDLLLQLARELEMIQPWQHHIPPIHVGSV